MPFITPTCITLLKLRPVDSSQLKAEEYRARSAKDRLGIVSIRKAENNHWQVRLAGDLSIGNKPHGEVYIWPEHWNGAAAALQQTIEAGRIKAVRPSFRSPIVLPTGKTLEISYKSQTDNARNPYGSCNVTSSAMCLGYWGIKGNDSGQLEDELYEWLQSNGLSRHDPIHLKRAIEHYGCRDYFSTRTTMAEIKAAIDAGNPVIVHGYFTGFGHIIVIVGYNEKGFVCHDPYGEWTSTGYIRNDDEKPNRGESILYSYGLIERTCLPDGGCWAHIVTRPTPSAVKI